MPEPSVIAPETLLATCGADDEVLARMIAGLRARLPPDLESLRAAVASGDLQRVRQAAHKLYGMVSAFSTTAGDETTAVEEQAEAGQAKNLGETLARLETVLAALVGELTDISVATLEARRESQ